MYRGAIVVILLALLSGIVHQSLAQTSGVNSLTISTSPEQLDCSTPGITLATLDLQKWSAYTFFWVGTQMPPADLSLSFCDSAGNALTDSGEGASIMRAGLELDQEIDGFMALEDLNGVSIRLNSRDTLLPGDYVMRHWVFESSVEKRTFTFPEDYTLVTACGNETNDRNGVTVDLYRGQVNEFVGNALVSHLAICERVDLSYVNPVTAPEALRQSDDVVHVFHARSQDTALARFAGGEGSAVAGPGFTVTSYTPGDVRYPWEEREEAADGEQGDDSVVADEPFAMLGSMAQLHRVSLPGGIDAVDVVRIHADGSDETILRVDQEQVDAVASGLVTATSNNRLVVSVSSLGIITFAMGPDDDGRVWYLEMDGGLAGPVSASSSRRSGPPGDDWS